MDGVAKGSESDDASTSFGAAGETADAADSEGHDIDFDSLDLHDAHVLALAIQRKMADIKLRIRQLGGMLPEDAERKQEEDDVKRFDESLEFGKTVLFFLSTNPQSFYPKPHCGTGKGAGGRPPRARAD